MNWMDIKEEPKGLHSGPQTVRISSVREYKNRQGNKCIELTLANEQGGSHSLRFSVERNRLQRIEWFLQNFLAMGFSDVVRHGGWDTLIGSELLVDVDLIDGTDPQIMPYYF
jgi:hypothetical protein